MINARRTDDIIPHFDDLKKYIYSHAKEFWFEKFVKEMDGKLYATNALEFDEEVETARQEYNDETMRTGLADALAQRDLVNKYWERGFETMDNEKRFIELTRGSDKWEREFDEHGLLRISVGK